MAESKKVISEKKEKEVLKAKKAKPDRKTTNDTLSKDATLKDAPSEGTTVEDEKKESYLKDILAVTGHGGLFRFISQARNGIIVQSLETGKRIQAFASMKVSALEDIAVYTDEEEVRLAEIFKLIHKKENGGEAISHKSSSDELKAYFSEILVNYDRDRVYVSDIKKIVSWYNALLKFDLLKFEA